MVLMVVCCDYFFVWINMIVAVSYNVGTLDCHLMLIQKKVEHEEEDFHRE